MYTIFGNCVARPITKERDNWGQHFHNLHKDKINWRINHEQHNLQRAIQVMIMSKPDCINIVQLGGIHRVMVIDSEAPKSYNTYTKELGDASWVDTNPKYHGDELLECTWRMSLGGASDIHLNEKDQSYVDAYRDRNYIAQSKWELHTAIALIDKHAVASGHNIRIIPFKQSDHSTSMLSNQNKWQINAISKHYNNKRIFWYENSGAIEWKGKNYDTIVNDYLQPWLDKDI